MKTKSKLAIEPSSPTDYYAGVLPLDYLDDNLFLQVHPLLEFDPQLGKYYCIILKNSFEICGMKCLQKYIGE